MTIPWLALLVPLLEHWYIKTEALSFLYDDMDIISINNWTGNTVSLLTFCGGVNNYKFASVVETKNEDELLNKLIKIKSEKGMVSHDMNHHFVEVLLICGKEE